MKFIAMAAAAALIATPALAGDFGVTGTYKDYDNGAEIYQTTATVTGTVSDNINIDGTGIWEHNDAVDIYRAEVGATGKIDRFFVRAAVGQTWSDADDFQYWRVRGGANFDVPLTDGVAVYGQYTEAFGNAVYNPYGVGGKAYWNVNDFRLSAGVFRDFSDNPKTEYTVGVSRAF